MFIVKIILVVLGMAFLLFGYHIYFQNKYNLINGFKADYEAGRKDEQYAKRVGLIEFFIGIALIVCGILVIIYA